MPNAPSKRHNALAMAILAGFVVFAAGAAGSAATLPNITTWYAGLHKPAFTPPNWLFGPVWTALYLLMAIAFWRILTLARKTQSRQTAIVWFLIQICLNALWSIAFFGLHSPLFGLIVIAFMVVAIILTIVSFLHLDRLAGWLLVPYLLWVSFASALNAAVFLLNR